MTFFQTKQERREKILQRWSDEAWGNLPNFLMPWTGQILVLGESEVYYTRRKQENAATIAEWTSDPSKRREFITEWLDKAEKDSDFGVKLDRYLGLLTETEEAEKHSYHRRLLMVAGFVVAVVAVVLAIRTPK